MYNLVITLISFVGVLFIIQPAFLFGGVSPDNLVFYFVVLLAAFTGSFSFIFLHDLRGKIPELIVLQHGYLTQATLNYFLYLILDHDNEKSIAFLKSLTAW